MFNFFKKKENIEERTVTSEAINSSGFVSLFEDWLSKTTSKAESISSAYACIRIISNTVATNKIQHYKISESGKEPLSGTKIDKMLRFPKNMTYHMWLKNMTHDLVAYGNSYSWIRNGELIYIPEKNVSIYTINDGNPDTDSHYYQVTFKGQSFKLFPEDIVHFKNITDITGINGISPIQYHKSTFDTMSDMEDYMRYTLKNGSGISGVLESEKALNASTIEDLRQNFQSKFSGFRNSGKTPVLPQGLSYKQLKPLSPADMDFIASKKLTKEDVAEIFGVPMALLGSQEQSYNNLTVLSLGFFNFTIKPILDMMCDELSSKLVPYYAKAKEVIYYETDTIRMSAPKEKAETVSLLVNTGIITPNEAREYYSKTKMDGGDELKTMESNIASPKDPELISEGNNASPADPKTDATIVDQKTQK